ncbi:ubiquinol oxidase subunit II [Solidesulfovibrio sp.]|uniref:ubiquinol oxidase subunit II n=1 Tax=Solidesulfovibrio sp. TaxID=2910990 RepID=UPI00260A3251|nr:ubiquinol oxidase subunit II [Solidesulfovibrio sp.]
MARKLSFACVVLTLLCAATFLQGCSELVLLNPKGPIGESERFLILTAFVLMLLVVLPVIVMSVWFPLKYRASNTKAAYEPEWSHSGKIEAVMWCIPLVIVLILSVLVWRYTHRLDPYKPIDPAAAQFRVDVVSLDWKWLFIYPEQGIAVVNELAFPARTPLSFQLTSDTVMTSFFIPQLGSQIYAMAGMRTRLHLLADEPGVYAGHNQQFSGAGYPTMFFAAKALSPEQFEAWTREVKKSPNTLDPARFEQLRKPSSGDPVTYFSSVSPDMFEYILNLYSPLDKVPGGGPGQGHAGQAQTGHGHP